jgi:hypothetical protein
MSIDYGLMCLAALIPGPCIASQLPARVVASLGDRLPEDLTSSRVLGLLPYLFGQKWIKGPSSGPFSGRVVELTETGRNRVVDAMYSLQQLVSYAPDALAESRKANPSKAPAAPLKPGELRPSLLWGIEQACKMGLLPWSYDPHTFDFKKAARDCLDRDKAKAAAAAAAAPVASVVREPVAPVKGSRPTRASTPRSRRVLSTKKGAK